MDELLVAADLLSDYGFDYPAGILQGIAEAEGPMELRIGTAMADIKAKRIVTNHRRRKRGVEHASQGDHVLGVSLHDAPKGAPVLIVKEVATSVSTARSLLRDIATDPLNYITAEAENTTRRRDVLQRLREQGRIQFDTAAHALHWQSLTPPLTPAPDPPQ